MAETTEKVLAGRTSTLSFLVPVIEPGLYECSFAYPYGRETTLGAIDHIVVH
jgi:hypothetical protein